ncbi:MAG TPA: hypothetical protein VFV99_24680 [Kofleriaceae bacterium]|nr:hypothetical protein [Kofleriaceae bacterium]
MRLCIAAVVLAACGGGGGTQAPDASPPDAPIDMPPMFAACREFGGSTATVPAHVTGSLAGPDVQSPSQCTAVDAPYGIESAGPDAVVRIDGLVPGTAYIVQLDSPEDLAFYVVSGCSTPSGPAANECSLFVDASAGSEEVGRFVAASTTTYIVVDYYASHTPANQTFALDVYAEACTTNSQCSAGAPVCSNGKCVQCASSFDCVDSQAPVCDRTAQTCGPGSDMCLSDDSVEPADDGPAGARALVPNGGGFASATGEICSTPRSEADFYSFQVTSVGEVWDFSLLWAGTDDLDLEIFDANGSAYGLSYWEQPEAARLTYLPTGTYFVKISDFTSQTTTPVAYTLSARRTAGPGCTTRADCASEYRNQIFRGDCVAGACVKIEGAGLVEEGGACDSVSDCGSMLSCPSFFFVANADTRDVCARTCSGDADCAALGESYVCTTYLIRNFCVQKCTTNEQCATSLDSTPMSGPWYRLTCTPATGRCAP